MKTTHSLRNLSLFAILTVLGATAHAAPSYQPQQLAENGSQRTLDRNAKLRAEQAVKVAEGGSERSPKRATNSPAEPQELAENGSQRTLERNDKLRAEQAVKVAEGGSERSPKRATNTPAEPQELAENGSQRALEQADKARADRALKVAEGGSDRLLAWHAERAV